MAIKGKRKSKQRAVPRAPRRDPVPVPVAVRPSPMGAGRGGVPAGRRRDDAVRRGHERRCATPARSPTPPPRPPSGRAAATEYRAAVQSAFGQVGVVNPGVPPTVFVEMDAALDRLPNGNAPADAAADAPGRREGRGRGRRVTRRASTWRARCATRASSPCRWPRSPGRPARSCRPWTSTARRRAWPEPALDAEGAAAERLTTVAVELRDTAESPAHRGVERVPRRPAGRRPERGARPRAASCRSCRAAADRLRPARGEARRPSCRGQPHRGARQGREAHRRRRLDPPRPPGRARDRRDRFARRDGASVPSGRASEGAAIVAVIGGDGTVSCAANGLLGTERGARRCSRPAPGDDFAKAIGAGAFRLGRAVCSRTRRSSAIDVVRVRAGDAERRFVNIAGAGFDSEVNETANAMTVNLGGTRHVRGGARQDALPVHAGPLRAHGRRRGRSRSTRCSSSSAAASPTVAG